MLRLSRLTDYGIVLLAHLAAQEDRGCRNAREMAEAAHLPLPVVSKLLKRLAREGLLVSQRGARGGYSLARPPEEVTVAEAIGALEGPIALTECGTADGRCPQEATCHVRDPWQQINQVLHEALARLTLSDLVRGRDPRIIPLSELGIRQAAAPGEGAEHVRLR